jgi:hypothetical protein
MVAAVVYLFAFASVGILSLVMAWRIWRGDL